MPMLSDVWLLMIHVQGLGVTWPRRRCLLTERFRDYSVLTRRHRTFLRAAVTPDLAVLGYQESNRLERHRHIDTIDSDRFYDYSLVDIGHFS